MAAILGKAWEGYKFMFDELPDQRTKSWFLIAKPYQCITLLGLYLMFVLKWGPQYMKGRPAYNLDRLLKVYNIFQVVACVYVFYHSLVLAWAWNYKWICEPVDRTNSGRPLEIAKTSYVYFIMKVVDLLDTVFFVLRKKHKQVSFLHIYHHTGMVILIWGAVTYLPGGHGTLIGVINTFVHIVMYSYYLYTVVRPSAKQSVWWKKYITQLQILQFFWCVVHMLVIVFKSDCAYPRWTSAVFLPQNCFILALFVDFYIRTYIKKPAEQINKQNINKNLANGPISENGFKNGGKMHNGVLDETVVSLQSETLDPNEQNGIHSPQNGTRSLNNYANGIENGFRRLHNETHRTNSSENGMHSSLNGIQNPQNGNRHNSENGSNIGASYHIANKIRKHDKLD